MSTANGLDKSEPYPIVTQIQVFAVVCPLGTDRDNVKLSDIVGYEPLHICRDQLSLNTIGGLLGDEPVGYPR